MKDLFVDKFQDCEILAGQFGLFDQTGKCLFYGSEEDCNEELRIRTENSEADEAWDNQNIFEK